jgi:hypothetical protein
MMIWWGYRRKSRDGFQRRGRVDGTNKLVGVIDSVLASRRRRKNDGEMVMRETGGEEGE